MIRISINPRSGLILGFPTHCLYSRLYLISLGLRLYRERFADHILPFTDAFFASSVWICFDSALDMRS